MKYPVPQSRLLLMLCTLLVCVPAAFSQVSSDVAVRLTAIVDTSTPSIRIQWPFDANATNYTIYKKPKTNPYWIETLITLPGSDSSFTDFAVGPDSSYEYRVQKFTATVMAEGYINTGWNIRPAGSRGKVVLVVDNSLSGSLSAEITRLMQDISGDGWAVLRHDVSGSDSVPDVKALILQDYADDPGTVKAVFLLGHVPVPYSGDINPDGHPDHLGAWPADVYYGDMDGVFTDQYVNDMSASRPENQNVPGDGKFDQSMIPTNLELQVGRVDLSNMPAFPYTEMQLIKRYLDKDHAYRTGALTAISRGLVSDNFGFFSGEAFASNAWRNFTPLMGQNATQEVPFFPTLYDSTYLWAYGCGPGWYQGAGGVGTTSDFAADTVHAIFTMLFGSYFGDWDISDNFLRAPLASADRALTCCWAGRPYWQFHHMALGENIGYSARLTQNNTVTYMDNYGGRFVHIALMGDPTLRMYVIRPVPEVQAVASGPEVEVTWDPTADSVDGYFVYRSQELFGMYQRLTPQAIPDLSFSDTQPPEGMNYYMVRPVRLETTPSGSFYNEGTGSTDSVNFIAGVGGSVATDLPGIRVYPNPTKGPFTIEFRKDAPDEFTLSILDLTGREIQVRQIDNPSKSRSISVNSVHLSPGTYFIRVTGENVQYATKITTSN